jgi:parallel beta-helix repeat protein
MPDHKIDFPTPSLPTDRRALLAGIGGLAAGTFLSAGRAEAGTLTPPGAPAPTGKPLTEVEPRVAVNATNTPGGANSLFRITQPGSYYLTGNVNPLSKSGIEIAAHNVTLDLMGFNIQAFFGAIKGVTVDAPRNNITIRNGTVSGFPQGGIDLTTSGVGGLIERVHASSNSGEGGIITGLGALVRDCTATSNNGRGIVTSAGCTIINCTAQSNSGDGIVTTTSCTVSNCSAYNNSGDGVRVGGGSTVFSCSARFNTLDGIQCDSGCLILSNTCSANGSGDGDGAGIHARLGANRIEGNNCTAADRGIHVDDPGNVIVRNTCSGNTTNWVIVANNYYGPIIDRTGVATAAVNGSAASGTLATTDPNANFTY